MLNEYKHILVPVDDSKLSEDTLLKASEVAVRNHARIDVLNVLNTTNFGFAYGVIDSNTITDIVDDQISYLKKLVAKVSQKTGVKDIHMHVRFGNPKNIITYDFTSDYNIDLIMMGATGKNAAARIFEGSVASYVNTHAPCDVLIVRTGLDNKILPKK